MNVTLVIVISYIIWCIKCGFDIIKCKIIYIDITSVIKKLVGEILVGAP